jgi:hypothetical protein
MHFCLKLRFGKEIADIACAILSNSIKQSANVVALDSRAFMALFAGFRTIFNCSTSYQNCRSWIIALILTALTKISGCSLRIFIK